nr:MULTISPECIES: helix-turn-helix transcriptional regulator [unclassified Fusibacter]
MINKTNGKVLGSIIKMNRLRQNMSQKALSEGICVNSYLSRIENAEILPSEEVIGDLFSALAIDYRDDEVFINKAYEDFNAFLDGLMFNEFDQSNKMFLEIETNEEAYVNSPVIIDYYIIKLAYYCTQSREVFNETKSLLKSVKELMTPSQKFKYYLYTGIDTLKVAADIEKAKVQFEKAAQFGSNGHLYNWLGYAQLASKRPIQAMDHLKKALECYVSDGNITSIIGAYEMIGLIYYTVSDYQSGIESYKKALRYAKSTNRDYHVINISNQIAWGLMRTSRYDQALETLVDDRYNSDITVNASVTKFLIGYYLKSPVMLDALKQEFNYRNKSMHRMIYSVLLYDEYFDDKGTWLIGEDELKSLYEFAAATHFELEKAFREIAIDYYKSHRKYKEALMLTEGHMEL